MNSLFWELSTWLKFTGIGHKFLGYLDARRSDFGEIKHAFSSSRYVMDFLTFSSYSHSVRRLTNMAVLVRLCILIASSRTIKQSVGYIKGDWQKKAYYWRGHIHLIATSDQFIKT